MPSRLRARRIDIHADRTCPDSYKLNSPIVTDQRQEKKKPTGFSISNPIKPLQVYHKTPNDFAQMSCSLCSLQLLHAGIAKLVLQLLQVEMRLLIT